MIAIRDSLDVLYGKWKIPIIAAVYYGNKRFKDIKNEIPGLTDKSLAKELKEMVGDGLLARVTIDAFPPLVQYELTEYSESLKPVIDALFEWGFKHRKKMLE